MAHIPFLAPPDASDITDIFLPAVSTPDPLRSVYTSNLPAMLDHFGITLVVSTYQAGKVILVRNDGGAINTHFRTLQKTMGIAVDGPWLTVGG